MIELKFSQILFFKCDKAMKLRINSNVIKKDF
jgi:hypothetical protein